LIFKVLDVSPTARIARHVADLEQQYGRVTACCVALKGQANITALGYEVNIRLALTRGRQVDMSRTPKTDERRCDLSFAINDVSSGRDGPLVVLDVQPLGRWRQTSKRSSAGFAYRDDSSYSSIITKADASG
jgi:hypothetical protein